MHPQVVPAATAAALRQSQTEQAAPGFGLGIGLESAWGNRGLGFLVNLGASVNIISNQTKMINNKLSGVG